MASIQREHYFLPGRKSKNGGPGILVVEGQYKYRKNKANIFLDIEFEYN